MKKIVFGITFLLAGLIFLLSGEFYRYENASLFWAIRQNALFYTGVIAWLYMTLAMCLVMRSPLIDRLTNGMDKAWGLHKWAGITATVFALAHWLDEKVPQWLVSAGWLAHPGELGSIVLTDWQTRLLDAGLFAVRWSLYVMAALVVISLMKKVPYHWFCYIHRIFPVIYIITAFHVITVLFKSYWWETPSGIALVIITLPGVYCAVAALFGRIGKRNKYNATIADITHHNNLIEVTLQTEKPFIHAPGQFAFVTFAHSAESHPYTISSCCEDNNRVRFAIKSLGDYTAKLPSTLIAGQKAIIEGPYGRFDFTRVSSRQVWVAGGIGITPFLSQLEYLHTSGKTHPPVDFWYCVNSEQDAAFPGDLAERCERAGVTLHTLYADKGQRLDAGMIMERCDYDTAVNVWFCGPAPFASVLREGLQDLGLNGHAFHSDSFAMR